VHVCSLSEGMPCASMWPVCMHACRYGLAKDATHFLVRSLAHGGLPGRTTIAMLPMVLDTPSNRCVLPACVCVNDVCVHAHVCDSVSVGTRMCECVSV
jgi:hypothetical protein